MQVFNKKYCLIKKKYYICITKLIIHLKTNIMKAIKKVLNVLKNQINKNDVVTNCGIGFAILLIGIPLFSITIDIINNGSKML